MATPTDLKGPRLAGSGTPGSENGEAVKGSLLMTLIILFVINPDSSARYSHKELKGMLVWSPNHCVSDAKRELQKRQGGTEPSTTPASASPPPGHLGLWLFHQSLFPPSRMGAGGAHSIFCW